ncbi:MAG: glycosyltransferase, partial [Bacteroidota bacterium]|nr:glycosyltransferase [Bacteroidota bacterium]
IVPLVKNDLFKITIPSKLYESMAAGIPVLLSVDGEARRILEDSKCGLFIEPGNSEMLAEKILKLYNDRTLLEELGKNGRNRVELEFDRSNVIKKFFDILIENG